MPNIITLNCACYGGGATVHAPVFQTGVQAQVDDTSFRNRYSITKVFHNDFPFPSLEDLS